MENIRDKHYIYQLYFFRHVFLNLISQQLKARYQRSFLGFLWSFLNPLMSVAVYAFLVSIVFRITIENYVVYLMAGLIPYNFFNQTVTTASASLIGNEHYYKNYYMPKMLFPLVSVGVAFFDFAASLLAVTTIGFFLGFRIALAQVILPVSLLLLLAFTVAQALVVSIIGAFFEDFRHLLTVLLQLLLFATPIVYPPGMVPEHFRFILEYNPLYYLIGNFSSPMYYCVLPSLDSLLLSTAIASGSLIFAFTLFIKYESLIVLRR